MSIFQSPILYNKRRSLRSVFCWWRGMDSFNNEGLALVPLARSVSIERWFANTMCLRLAKCRGNPPSNYNKKHLLRSAVCGGEGWIRLVAQSDACVKRRSVSIERWFSRHYVSAPCKTIVLQGASALLTNKKDAFRRLLCWWRGMDSNHRSH